MSRITIEVCVENKADLTAAIAGGAHRIELCSALALGGLTPSVGLMHLAARSPIPVYSMQRPRSGSFVYSPDELDLIRRDIDAVAEVGLQGVVIGASKPSGDLDVEACLVLVSHARAQGLAVTLHRAIDLAPDPVNAVDVAVDLGVERVLTSGGARTAIEGIETIAAMVNRAGDRLSVMAGASVNGNNIAELVRRTGIKEVHGSFSQPSTITDPRLIELGFTSPNQRGTNAAEVANAVAAVSAL